MLPNWLDTFVLFGSDTPIESVVGAREVVVAPGVTTGIAEDSNVFYRALGMSHVLAPRIERVGEVKARPLGPWSVLEPRDEGPSILRVEGRGGEPESHRSRRWHAVSHFAG